MGSMQPVIGKDWHTKVLSYQLKRLQRSTFILTVRAKELRLIRQTERGILQPTGLAATVICRWLLHNIRLLYLWQENGK